MENGAVIDTGTYQLPASSGQMPSFGPGKLGDLLNVNLPGLSVSQFSGFSGSTNAHSVSLWFDPGNSFGTIIDFTTTCGVNGNLSCGIRMSYQDDHTILVHAGTDQVQNDASIAVSPAMHSVVVTEQKNANFETVRVSVYVDGVFRAGIPLGAGNLFASVADTIQLPGSAGFRIDEVEIWDRDLTSEGPETLCVNGFDGEWSFATATCLLTSN